MKCKLTRNNIKFYIRTKWRFPALGFGPSQISDVKRRTELGFVSFFVTFSRLLNWFTCNISKSNMPDTSATPFIQIATFSRCHIKHSITYWYVIIRGLSEWLTLVCIHVDQKWFYKIVKVSHFNNSRLITLVQSNLFHLWIVLTNPRCMSNSRWGRHSEFITCLYDLDIARIVTDNEWSLNVLKLLVLWFWWFRIGFFLFWATILRIPYDEVRKTIATGFLIMLYSGCMELFWIHFPEIRKNPSIRELSHCSYRMGQYIYRDHVRNCDKSQNTNFHWVITIINYQRG